MDEDERPVTLCIGDLLMFITGADRLPPMGFPDVPVIEFNHNPSVRLPTPSTCAPSITLPMSQASSYDHFQDMMIQGLVQGFGFGNI